MVRTLLIRGMICGFLAGLLVFTFAKIFGEPQVDHAIAFETAMDNAKMAADLAKGIHDMPEPALVSRNIQAGFGLLTGVMVYCTAFGGLFALVFAYANGRAGRISPRGISALLALCGIVAMYIVPNLKYPANPPSVGHTDTIGLRTGLYVSMMVLSIAAMVLANMARKHYAPKYGNWTASLWAAAGYFVAVALVAAFLPPVNEVPANFPAVVLWQFRIDSLAMQCIMWGSIGLGFGYLTERAAKRQWQSRSANPGWT